MTDTCFLAFSNHNFLSKATNYFSHMLQQRWEAKILREKICLNQVPNSQSPGHKSDLHTTDPLSRGSSHFEIYFRKRNAKHERMAFSVNNMTWWEWLQLEANFFPVYFRLSSLKKHVRKVVEGFGKKSYKYWCEKARKHMYVTNRHDMTLAVKVALNRTMSPFINTLKKALRKLCGKRRTCLLFSQFPQYFHPY